MIPVRTYSLVLVVFMAAGISGALADGITLTAPQSDFSVLAGNEAVITLVAENTYDHDVQGNLIVVTSTMADPPGPSGLPVNDSRKKIFTMFRGVSNFTLSSGVADTPSERLIEVTFVPDAERSGKVILGPLTVHYLKDPPLTQTGGPPVKSSTEQVTGSPQPGGSSGTGSGSGSGGQPAPGTGGSGTGAANSQGSGSFAPSPVAYQAPADSGALKSLVTAENEKAVQNENDLTEKIATDPRVKAIDANLTTQGFGNYDKTFVPVNQSSGRATWSYRDAAGRTATLSAGITENVVRDVTVSSSDPSVIPKNLADDGAIRQSMSALQDKGYTPERYGVTEGSDGQKIEVVYRNNESRTATLSASIVNGTVISTTVKEDFNFRSLVLPFILALLPAGIAVSHFYYQGRKKNSAVIPQGGPTPGGIPKYYAVVSHLLDSAESAYNKGRYTEACGLAGRALRIFISGRYAGGIELTDNEIIALVSRHQSNHVSPATDILALCSLVRFGKGTPSGEEFHSVIQRIRKLLEWVR